MAQAYHLGIDVGTNRVAAATARLAPDGSVVVARVPLGRRSDSVPAVVFVAADGELLFGEIAEQRGFLEPERLIREFTRRLGDDMPLLVAGHRLPAEQLLARIVAHVISTVSEREGQPAGVVVTHPAAWGPHRTGLARAALTDLGLGRVELMAEPVAAALNLEATHPLEAGQVLVVYDLGGGTFTSAVLRREQDDSVTLLGEPAGIDNLGGADFDDAVFRHVLTSAHVAPADLSTEEGRLALTQLRRECVDAKEALSFDTDVAIPVLVPPARTAVRLTRSEFEDMIEQDLDRTLDTLEETVEGAGIRMAAVGAIALIGGSSRIPRIAQRLSEAFDRPLVIDADPSSSIALGAARAGLARSGAIAGTPGTMLVRPAALSPDLVATPPDDAPAGDLVPAGAATGTPGASRGAPRWHTALSFAALALAAGLVIGSSVSGGLFGAGDTRPAALPASPSPTPAASPIGPSADTPPAAGAASATVLGTATDGLPSVTTLAQPAPPLASPRPTPSPVSSATPSLAPPGTPPAATTAPPTTPSSPAPAPSSAAPSTAATSSTSAPTPTVEPEAEPVPTTEPPVEPEPSPATTPEPSPASTVEPSPASTPEPSPEATSEPSPGATPEPGPTPASTPEAAPTPTSDPFSDPIPV